MLFIETDSPPPFYQESLTPAKRKQLDKWFIGNRSQRYYLKRFEQFDQQGYLSPKWHWAAFFLSPFLGCYIASAIWMRSSIVSQGGLLSSLMWH